MDFYLYFFVKIVFNSTSYLDLRNSVINIPDKHSELKRKSTSDSSSPNSLRQWRDVLNNSNRSEDDQPASSPLGFQHFVEFVLLSLAGPDIHLMGQAKQCMSCQAKYEVIGHYETMEEDRRSDF